MNIIEKQLGARLQNAYGTFLSGAYRTEVDGMFEDHIIAYRKPIVARSAPWLVRLNSACFSGDLLGCDRCDCNWQLHYAFHLLSKAERGIIIYHLRQDGRGNGVVSKIKCHLLQDTENISNSVACQRLGIPVDTRKYQHAALILRDFHIEHAEVLTNNPAKISALEEFGLKICKIVAIRNPDVRMNEHYGWKRAALGHLV
jgi:3,4-dihydroxy 2-butanone 4-phosphate synthase / GTP cyclohydrolase II